MEENKKNVPKVRFPGFTDPWEQRKFGELCSTVTKQTGFDYTATIKNSLLTEASEDTLPYLQTKNFAGVSIDYNTDYYIPKSVAKEFPKINLDEKCLLFSIVGASVGNIGYFPGDKHCFLSGAICVSKLLNQEDADFLYHYMCSECGQSQIRTCTKGGAQATITIEDIRDFTVLLPSEDERKRIGEFLTNLDKTITLHQRELSNLEKQKEAVMKKIFSQEVRFKRPDGSEFPEWHNMKMGQITVEYKVRNKKRLPLEIFSVNNEVGFLPQSEQFEDAGYLRNTDTSIYMIVPPNHFAYNPARINVGSIGYQNVGHDVQVSSLYEVFKTTTAVYDTFLWHWFHTSDFNKAVLRLQEGGVRQYYYYEKLKETRIKLPCLEEQRLIADFLSNFDEVIAAAKKELELWKKLKKGLLQQMFV